MLKRSLEPEVMDTQDEAIAYDDMDHRDVNTKFVDDFVSYARSVNVSLAGEFLDIGTGTARIPIQLCDTVDDVCVFAIDLSVEMLDIARLNIELSPHRDRIMLGRSDAKQLDMESDRYDAVISNSIVHHIPDPASTFSEAVRVCRPQGILFFRDLMRPESQEQLQQLVETYAGDEAEHARKMFEDSLHAAFTLREIQDFVAELGFAAESVNATSDRHWTWCGMKP